MDVLHRMRLSDLATRVAREQTQKVVEDLFCSACRQRSGAARQL